jgi:YVTN family beta-propeller protein
MPDNGESRDRLESWKEIAAYLKRDVRTVQRWEKSEKLPVHRHMHGTQGTISASKQELATWAQERNLNLGKLEEEAAEVREAAERGKTTALDAESAAVNLEREKRRYWLRVLAIVTVGLLAGLAGWLYHYQRTRSQSASGVSAPVRVGRFSGVAFSEEGHISWIPLGGEPGPAIRTPDGAQIYVAYTSSNFITVFDTGKNAVTGTIELEGPTGALAISPDGKQIYAGSRSANLSVIQVDSKAVTRIETSGPDFDIAVTPDGEKAYLAMEISGLKRLRLSGGKPTNGKLEDIPTVKCPVGLALNPNGTTLYVSYQCGGPGGRSGHDAIGIFDVATDKFRGSITGFPNVGGQIVVSPDGSYLWVPGGDACAKSDYDHLGCPVVPGNVINLFNTASNTLVGTLGIERPSGYVQVSLFPDSSRALVFGGPELTVISMATQATLETLPVPFATSVIFSPDSRHAYITLKEKHALAVLNIPPGECEPSPLGQSGFWPGDGNGNDVRGSNHAQMYNGATFAAGRVGQAFRFDGHGAYASVANPGTLVGFRTSGALQEEVFSFGAWVKLDDRSKPGVMPILDEMPSTAHSGARIVADAQDHFRFCLVADSAQDCLTGPLAVAVSTTKAVAAKWFHVVGVKSLGKVSIYVNGILETTATSSASSWKAANGDMYIGGNPINGTYFGGLIDEVVFYERALSDSDVRQIYQAGNLRTCGQPELVPH